MGEIGRRLGYTGRAASPGATGVHPQGETALVSLTRELDGKAPIWRGRITGRLDIRTGFTKRYISRTLRSAFLATDITEEILDVL
jgi:hypothetical protein